MEGFRIIEIRQRQTLHFITYKWNLKSKRNEYYKIEADSPIQRTNSYQWGRDGGQNNSIYLLNPYPYV